MQNVKSRAWVKNAAIIFLSALLVLTFFSNTIMNRSLPEVATQSVVSGPITVRVRGTGVVTAVGAYELKADQTRKIQSVLVRAGQEVSAGDLLFVLGEGASEELEQAAETLRQLELSYKRAAASVPVYDYTQLNREKAAAQQAVAEAQAALDRAEKDLQDYLAISGSDQAIAQYKDELVKAQEGLSDALRAQEEVKATIAEERATTWLWLQVLEEKESALTVSIAAASSGGSGSGGGTDPSAGGSGTGGGTDPSVDGTGGGTDSSASGSGTGGETDSSAGGSGTGGETDSSAGGNGTGGGTDPSAGGSGSISYSGTQQTLHLAPIRILFAIPEKNKTEEEMGTILATELAAYDTDEAKLQRVKELIVEAKAELDSTESDPRLGEANENVIASQARLDALLAGKGAYAENYIAARDALAAAQKALSDIEYTIAANGRSSASSAIELQDLAEQIARAKAKLEELSGGEDNQVVAPVSGIIESIGYTAGNTAPKGEVLCRIQVPDMGYTLSFSVTNEQARRLRIGDTATVSNYYWGSEILATLSAIQTDPQSPQTGKRLTFDVTGDVNPGSELTIAVGSRSQNYDIVVPNSAIRTDSNGSFVLLLEAKNSPLGNRYFARRVEVTVLAQDDVSAAVSGDLGYGDFVITTSDRPVSVGDQVRMSDKG